MRIALVANPCSGGKKTRKLLPQAEKKLHAKGVETDIYLSRYSTHIRELAMDLDLHRYDAVVAMGGDGTNFHLINGLMSRPGEEDLPPVGIIPAGSGNSFVRDLGIFTLDQAVEAIRRNRPRPVDVISYSGKSHHFFFVNLMGLGFVTDVAVTAEKFKIFHDFSYLIGVAWQTISLDAQYMEIEIDGKRHSGEFCFAEFCNSKFTGGSMLMAPGARIDDGLMDIVLARAMPRSTLVTSLPKIYKGTHLEMDQITCLKGKSVKLITHGKERPLLPDGEILGTTPGNLNVLPGALRYLS